MTRQRFSTQVDATVQARARAAVRGVAAVTGADYTLAQLVEDALTRHVTHLEAHYNNDQPWPGATTRLRPGSRLKGP